MHKSKQKADEAHSNGVTLILPLKANDRVSVEKGGAGNLLTTIHFVNQQSSDMMDQC